MLMGMLQNVASQLGPGKAFPMAFTASLLATTCLKIVVRTQYDMCVAGAAPVHEPKTELHGKLICLLACTCSLFLDCLPMCRRYLEGNPARAWSD